MSALVPFFGRPFGSLSNMLDDFFYDIMPMRQSLLGDIFKLDIRETDNSYLIDAELPGINKDDVKLELDDDLLTISVQHKDQKEETKDNYIHRERRYGTMKRVIRLANAKADDISARFENGILQITVPKEAVNSRVRQIEIQ